MTNLVNELTESIRNRKFSEQLKNREIPFYAIRAESVAYAIDVCAAAAAAAIPYVRTHAVIRSAVEDMPFFRDRLRKLSGENPNVEFGNRGIAVGDVVAEFSVGFRGARFVGGVRVVGVWKNGVVVTERNGKKSQWNPPRVWDRFGGGSASYRARGSGSGFVRLLDPGETFRELEEQRARERAARAEKRAADAAAESAELERRSAYWRARLADETAARRMITAAGTLDVVDYVDRRGNSQTAFVFMETNRVRAGKREYTFRVQTTGALRAYVREHDGESEHWRENTDGGRGSAETVDAARLAALSAIAADYDGEHLGN